MATSVLTDAELDQLRGYNTPTISNAIELFDVRPRHAGFLPHQIRCLLPELGPIVGYAVTSQTRATVARARRSEDRSARATTCGMWREYPAPRSRSAGTGTSRPAWGRSSAK